MNRVTRPRLATRLSGGEGQGADADVGIPVFGVGVGVVAVVLVDPPAVAQSDGQVAVDQADEVVGPFGAEDLPVTGVVADEPDLGEHHRQERGDGELPPGVAHHDEHGPGRGEQPAGDGDLRQVVAGSSLQQAGGLDPAHQIGEVTPAGRHGGAAARRVQDGCAEVIGAATVTSRGPHRDQAGDASPGVQGLFLCAVAVYVATCGLT